MKYLNPHFLAFSFIFLTSFLYGQDSPIGIWKTVDDNSGEARSYVEIYEEGGELYGKIVKLLQYEPHTTCPECPGDKKDQPLIGMEILWGLQSYKDYWSYGRIMDPENGKTYKCSVYLESENELRIRGYIGISAFGRNQSWYRVKS